MKKLKSGRVARKKVETQSERNLNRVKQHKIRKNQGQGNKKCQK